MRLDGVPPPPRQGLLKTHPSRIRSCPFPFGVEVLTRVGMTRTTASIVTLVPFGIRPIDFLPMRGLSWRCSARELHPEV